MHRVRDVGGSIPSQRRNDMSAIGSTWECVQSRWEHKYRKGTLLPLGKWRSAVGGPSHGAKAVRVRVTGGSVNYCEMQEIGCNEGFCLSICKTGSYHLHHVNVVAAIELYDQLPCLR